MSTPKGSQPSFEADELDLDSVSQSDIHGPRLRELEPLPPSRRVGRYRLIYELATGGMATIYLARAEGPGGFEKLVAVKCILPHLAKNERYVEMFFDEARIAGRIDHPNVCSVFDFGVEDGEHYIAMEYVVGETIGRVVHHAVKLGRSLPPPAVARIVADACEGLHAAHELRDKNGASLEVVHRDVSPQNLFIAYDGSVRVMDFGIARATDRIHHTQTGMLKGKLAYMAPEQLRRKTVDRRTDVWALGVVLWEMLTRERLFKRESEVETIKAVDSAAITDPRTFDKAIPEALAEIALKALERDMEARYASARELGRDLRRFLASCGEPLGPPEIAELMTELFVDEHADHMRIVEEAQTVSETRAPVTIAAGPEPDPSESKVVEKRAAPVVDDGSAEVRRRLKIGAMIAAASMALGAVTATVVSWAEDDGEPVATAGAGPGSERSGHPEGVPAAAAPSEAPAAEAPAAGLAPTDAPEAVIPTPIAPPAADDSPAPSDVAEAPEDPEAAATGEDVEAPRAGPEEPPEAPDAPPEPEAPARPTETDRSASRSTRRGRVARRASGTLETGNVSIVATGGWADIYLRGERVGRTPTRLTLPVGRHVLELRPNGRRPGVRRRVRVTANETARVGYVIE